MSKGEPTSISVMRNFLQRRGSGAKKRQCGHLPLPGQIWLNGDTRRGRKSWAKSSRSVRSPKLRGQESIFSQPHDEMTEVTVLDLRWSMAVRIARYETFCCCGLGKSGLDRSIDNLENARHRFCYMAARKFLRDAICFKIRELSLGLPALGLSPFPNWCNLGLAIGGLLRGREGVPSCERAHLLCGPILKRQSALLERGRGKGGEEEISAVERRFSAAEEREDKMGTFKEYTGGKMSPFMGGGVRYGRRRRQERREPRTWENAGSASKRAQACL